MLFRPRQRAFTLIELMIVVAIFAIISAVLVPSLLRARSQAREKVAEAASKQVTTERELPQGVVPDTATVQLQLRLEAEPLRVGFEVLNRYRLHHQGRYSFGLADQTTLIQIPLPEKNQAFGQFKVLRRVADGEWKVPQGLVMSPEWLAWAEAPGPDVEVEVRYQSEGEKLLHLALPPAGLHTEITAKLEGPEAVSVPPSGLRATQPGLWERSQILSPPPLVVGLPPLQDPLARVVKLFRLTGLAVLLFGAGFWYMGELHKTGSLKQFRFASFSLLAVNYSMFFVCFAVLGFHEVLTPSQNLLLSAALTAPLLSYHVAQILDWRFALTRALPLSLATLGLVYNGVYGAEYRDYVYLAYGLATGWMLTLSYRPFLAISLQRKERREAQLDSLLEGFTSAREEAREQLAGATELMESGRLRPFQAESLRLGVERFQEKTRHLELPSDPESASYMVEEYTRRFSEATLDLTREVDFLNATLSEPVVDEQSYCCLACGHQALGGQYCGHCSRPLPEIVPCSECQQENVIPRHLVASGDYHCHRCGHRREVRSLVV